jgi:hypothetical protein
MQKKNGTPANQDGPKKLPVPQMIIAGTAAEILGTTALLPFEATRYVPSASNRAVHFYAFTLHVTATHLVCRIRMVADPSFGNSMFEVRNSWQAPFFF